MNVARNRLFAAFSAAILLGTTVTAQETISRKTLDVRLDQGLYEASIRGTKLYNEQNDIDGCSRIYEGALLAVLPLLDHHPVLKTRANEAIDTSMKQNGEDRAHTLRAAIDEIRNALQTGSKNAPVGAVPNDKKDSTEPPKDSKPPRIEKEKLPSDLVYPYPGPDKRPEHRSEPDKTKPAERPNESKGSATPSKSLWDRLGGESAVRAIVHDAIVNMTEEPSLDLTRGGKFADLTKLERGLVAYISSKSGGPLEYKGPEMKTAHAGMQISEAQFNKFKAKLNEAFQNQKYNLSAATLSELDRIIEATKSDIVEK